MEKHEKWKKHQKWKNEKIEKMEKWKTFHFGWNEFPLYGTSEGQGRQKMVWDMLDGCKTSYESIGTCFGTM